MASQMRVGIIGVGTIGTVHSEAMKATGVAELVALCDINAPRLAEKAAKFGVKKTYADYRDLLKSDIQAVVIGTPNYLHHPMALAALAAGKHVLLEKPMTLNATLAADVVAAVKKSGKVLTIGMAWRQNPAVQVAKEYIDSGMFGHIYHIRAVLIRRRGIPGIGGWFTTKAQSGGGPMIDCGVHWFDASMYLSGHWKPTTVSAATYAKFGPRMKDYKFVDMWGPPDFDKAVFDVEDYSTGFVRFEGGATMVFDIVWAANAQDRNFIEFLGDKAGVRVCDSGPLTIMTEDHGKVADISPKFPAGANVFESEDRKFIEACQGLRPPEVPAEQGLVTMKLIDAIYASSQAGREVQIA